MSDLSNSAAPGASAPRAPSGGQPAGGNLTEYSVSEISQAVKRSLEDRFARVRVRGEISGFKRAASGHLYMALKDEGAVLDGVCWRGVAGRLPIQPEDGMEVIATGRISSYPGRSKYQLIVDHMELAGEGALLKLLEERKRKLAAEGLFEEARKKPLPFLPEVIGVVTSPTGAVIRDILHRLADRFPRRVLVWPVLVQGEGAAAQVAAAIEGFNTLPARGTVPRPDLLIVARGGGSLEDLWSFNEEEVARAAAASEIPLISAVGHETDTTLIDFVSDRRAPTPTAAAEIAVPLRRELLADLLDLERRLTSGLGRMLDERRSQVEGLGRGLPDPARLLEVASQRLDERAERLSLALKTFFQERAAEAGRLAAALPHPRQQLRFTQSQLAEQGGRLTALGGRLSEAAARDLAGLDAERRLGLAARRRIKQAGERLGALGQLLGSLSHEQVLKRGFALVRGPAGLVMRASQVESGAALEIEFADGKVPATAGEGAAVPSVPPTKPRKTSSKSSRKPESPDSQGRLL